MDTRLASPLHDSLPILIIADQAGQLLQCPHPKKPLFGGPASGHLIVLKMKPPSSPGCGYPPSVSNPLQLSSCTKYWIYTFRNLPRISFVKQERFKIKIKHKKLNLNRQRYNIFFGHLMILFFYQSFSIVHPLSKSRGVGLSVQMDKVQTDGNLFV